MQRYYSYRPKYNPSKKKNLKKGRIAPMPKKQSDFTDFAFSGLTNQNPLMSLLLKGMLTGKMDTSSIMRMLLAERGFKF